MADIRRTGGSFRIEHRIVLGDGRTKYVLGSGHANINEFGKVSSIFGTVQDITEAKVASIKMLQTSKLVSLGEMSAGIAHEINNPLGIISGSLGQLVKHRNNPEQFEIRLEFINKAVERINRIVKGLKKFSRSSEATGYGNYSLAEIVREALILTEARSKQFDTAVSCEISSESLIHCNDVEIEQVMVNLIHNAIDAVKDRNEKWVKIEVLDDIQFIVLRITDAGPGIPDHIRQKLFEPFFTTKKVGEGTGLGLSISKGILEEHRATIEVASLGGNTCFQICFNKIGSAAV